MRHTHENFDMNSDLNLFSKQLHSDQAQNNNFKLQQKQIIANPTEQEYIQNDYSQDDLGFFDQDLNLPDNNNGSTENTKYDYDDNNQSNEMINSSANNLELYPHDYKQEIIDFVNRASKLYSEENILFLQKELNNKGLILSFQPPPFNNLQCVICSDNAKNPIVFPCGHIYCQQCIDEWSKHSGFCPICHTELDKKNAIKIRSFLDTSPKKK